MTQRVRLVAHTKFCGDLVPEFLADDAGGASALTEFAGRVCYQSWSKPNAATAKNADYIAHLIEVGHLSVLEHGSVTFYVTGVSRSLTHELVRHRHFSYSQLSQRYVPAEGGDVVVPEIIEQAGSSRAFLEATGVAETVYAELVDGLAEFLKSSSEFAGWSRTELHKAARQAARSVLPNATETKIVVTGNHRAWRHFIGMRATRHADPEIRSLAVEILGVLRELEPAIYADFRVDKLSDGTLVASAA